MIIKDKFSLLQNIDNVLNLSSSKIESLSIPAGDKKLHVTLRLIENRINHFTKKKTFYLLEDIDWRNDHLKIVNYPEYPLVVSYNNPTKQIILNLAFFNTDDLSYVDPKDLYASLVYGISFGSLVSGKIKIKDEYATTISNFMLSIFVRIFGKEYGLLGAYSKEINKLKFLISCYIWASFFGAKGNLYSKAFSASAFDYKSIQKELDKFNFNNIYDFIKSLSYFNALPGINKYNFGSKFHRFLSLNFIPALEDTSRFIAIITTSSLVGISIIPTFIKYYNKSEYEKLLLISKKIF